MVLSMLSLLFLRGDKYLQLKKLIVTKNTIIIHHTRDRDDMRMNF